MRLALEPPRLLPGHGHGRGRDRLENGGDCRDCGLVERLESEKVVHLNSEVCGVHNGQCAERRVGVTLVLEGASEQR